MNSLSMGTRTAHIVELFRTGSSTCKKVIPRSPSSDFHVTELMSSMSIASYEIGGVWSARYRRHVYDLPDQPTSPNASPAEEDVVFATLPNFKSNHLFFPLRISDNVDISTRRPWNAFFPKSFNFSFTCSGSSLFRHITFSQIVRPHSFCRLHSHDTWCWYWHCPALYTR